MIDRNNNPIFLNDFLDYMSTILNKSPNTIKEYNYDLAHFLKFIYNRKVNRSSNNDNIKDIDIKDMDVKVLEECEIEDLHAFLAYMKTSFGSMPATLARKTTAIRTLYKYLCNKTKRISKNPAQDLENPKLGIRLPKYLNLEQSEKLLEVAQEPTNVKSINHPDHSKRNFAILTIFLNCGIRLSELVNMNLSDLDFFENKLTVIGKGNKERTIYLNDSCIKAIKDYLEVRPVDRVKGDDRNALFLSERYKRISNRSVQDIVKKELLLAGIDPNKYSVHKLRHTAATLMYQYGDVDIRALQELLGHASISTTEIYTHVNNEQVKNAVENNPLNKKRK